MACERKSKIELTTSLDDWKIIRECYVKSFFRYPLYKYMVPDESIRAPFLRAYLDANYEVTVGTGQGILLAIKVLVESDNETSPYYKVVGGVMFVPPSSDGCGWAVEDDEPYLEAYSKHGLDKISKDGVERLQRYEEFETENVAQRASGSRIPLWNGLFCAIEPDYASKGIGSALYKEAIRVMAKYWVKQQNSLLVPNNQHNTKPKEKQEKRGMFNKIFGNTSLSQLHRYSLLHHRGVPPASFIQKATEKKNETKQRKTTNEKQQISRPVTMKDAMFSPNSPLVVAVSHNDRAARFHQSNGFHLVSRLPFHDKVDDVTPFYTHVLVLDPFSTGRMEELSSALQEQEDNSKDPSSLKFYKNLQKLNPSSLLI